MSAQSQPRTTRSDAERRDSDDPLSRFRDRFVLPPDIIYLDGNSLGGLPHGVAERVRSVVEEQWGHDLVRSWNVHDWIDLPLRVGSKIARLIGAAADEVVVSDSTSVNLFKLMIAAVRARRGRHKILIDGEDFPTDIYVAQGVADTLGDGVRMEAVPGEEIESAIDNDTALVAVTQIDFRTGRALDLARLCSAAQESGALFLCDLSHSAGVMPIDLTALGVDLAVGCGYKYLNGGPGAPAFLYVARHLQADLTSPIRGWMGHAAPFEFSTEYRAADGVRRFMAGTPNILSLVALDQALDVTRDADIGDIRRKSLALTELFMQLIDQECAGHGFSVVTPRSDDRGSQVSLSHDAGYPIVQALIERGVIGDFRSPDLLRFGFAPLYTRFADVWDAVAILKNVMASELWKTERFQTRAAVT